MSPASRWAACAALALAACGVPRAAGAQLPTLNACSGPNAADQSFGAAATATAWALCWYDDGAKGLVITAAWFQKAPGALWRRVLADLRNVEIFVPYHDGDWQKRWYDMGPSGKLLTLTAQDCPAAEGGTLLSQQRPLGSPPPPQVCRELRPRGVAWRDYLGVRRGQELVLWGAYDAGGYIYLMEYAFRDDGVIVVRTGATGANHGNYPDLAHMHGILWRVDLDLNGPGLDRVKQLTHTETGWAAVDAEPLITVETRLDWNPHAFTGLLIEDAGLTNARGHTSGYMLVPIRTGTARHYGFLPKETWTHQDLAVTRDRLGELSYDIPAYVGSPGNPTVPETLLPFSDVVAWYWGSSHHHFRDEDGSGVPGAFQGVTQVMWTGFMLIPHNWLDKPPHWEPPPPCGPPVSACHMDRRPQ
jgi:hypothetical protein